MRVILGGGGGVKYGRSGWYMLILVGVKRGMSTFGSLRWCRVGVDVIVCLNLISVVCIDSGVSCSH